MRMSLILILCLLAGCGGVKEKPPLPANTAATPSVVIDRAELKRLLRDCHVTKVPADVKKRDLEVVATDLANARKAALVECNKRLQKAREKLGD